jgi:hypothetical protein
METALFIAVLIFVYGFGMYLGWQARKDFTRRKDES